MIVLAVICFRCSGLLSAPSSPPLHRLSFVDSAVPAATNDTQTGTKTVEETVVPPEIAGTGWWASARDISPEVLLLVLLLTGGLSFQLWRYTRALRMQSDRLAAESHRRQDADEQLARAQEQKQRAELLSTTQQKALRLVYDVNLQRGVSLQSLCRQLVLAVREDLDLGTVAIYRCVGGGLELMAYTPEYLEDEAVESFPIPETCLRALENCEPVIQRPDPAAAAVTDRKTSDDECPNLAVPIRDSDGTTVGIFFSSGVNAAGDAAADPRLFDALGAFLGRQFELDELRQDQAESRRLALLGQLTSGVAHEVRNPLNAILATADALAVDLGNHPEYGEYIRQIRKQVDRLAGLMRDLLDLGKPVRESNMAVCSLADVVEEAIELCRRTLPEAARRICFEPPGDSPAVQVAMERDKILQVLINLLANAAANSPADSSIQVLLNEYGEGWVKLAVVDGGTGIAEENLGRVFEPFFTTRRDGTGLGLSIVRHIIHSHGGSVVLRNNVPPPGCTAEVILPVTGGEGQ